MEYAEFEAFLAQLHHVVPEDMGAFAGRLRLLRDRVGVPLASGPGKGKRRKFTKIDIFETHLSLRMGEAGLPPARIKTNIEGIRALELFRAMRDTDRLYFLVIESYLNVGKSSEFDNIRNDFFIMEPNNILEYLKTRKSSEFICIVNLTALVREI